MAGRLSLAIVALTDDRGRQTAKNTPVGSWSRAMGPESKTSNAGWTAVPPASTARATVGSASSTET